MTQEKLIQNALYEAATWTDQLTPYERNSIPYSEARRKVLGRIYKKYAPKIMHLDFTLPSEKGKSKKKKSKKSMI